MNASSHDPLGDVDSFVVLGDERRRRLYDYVAGERRPVSRDEAAAAVGIGRSLAAYHLDRLAQASLLDVVFARPPGRSGPGAGRPAKHYVRHERVHVAQTPARDYAFVAQLLAEAVDRAGPDLAASVRELARERGREVGAGLVPGAGLEAGLEARGYQPRREPDGSLRLTNCPFHTVATAHPELVCGLNHAFIQGLLDGVGATGEIGELDPSPGQCCIVIRSRKGEAATTT